MIDVENFDPEPFDRMNRKSVPQELARWRELRAKGVQAASETREVAELRRWLLDNGYWREVYK